jgi:hypothetical protein
MKTFLTAALAAAVLVAPVHAQLRALTPLDASGRVTFFIAPGQPGSRYVDSDRELAVWALQAWSRAVDGRLRFEAAPEKDALVQVHWVPADAGQYGEMRPLLVNGRPGAAVYIRPDTSALGPDIATLAREDPLFRETVVYLTCLHELGHALGLSHTAQFADIMYFFGFGGDIPGFFMRYRKQIATRGDIAKVSGLSAGDIAAVRRLYQ